FNAIYRLRTHYLDILRAAANLVGTGHQYVHAHSLGFHASAGLSGFNAMLGGFSADALLKGLYLRKSSWLNRLHFLPRFHLGGHDRINSPTLLKLPEEIALQIRERRSN